MRLARDVIRDLQCNFAGFPVDSLFARLGNNTNKSRSPGFKRESGERGQATMGRSAKNLQRLRT